jgi:hypothetical protein
MVVLRLHPVMMTDVRETRGNMIRKIVCAVCLFTGPAMAQDLPKQGTTNFTDYSTVVNPKTMTMGKDSVTNYEVNGVSHNDDGGEMFNNMAIHCMGSITTINGEASSRGLCIQTDKEGDQLFQSYDNVGHPGQPYAATETFLGGTGKYTGLTGHAASTRQIVKGPDNLLMLVLPHHATWSRP